jgi:Ca2+-binding RTX toxin-like protein
MTIRFKELRLASLAAVAVAAVLAGAAGAGNAASAETFKQPKLKHGLLKIKGTHEGDNIAIRLRAGDPGVLDVDIDKDAVADFSFRRDEVTTIHVDAHAGDDTVTLDETNGVFTTGITTTVAGGEGNDILLGGAGAETLLGGDGDDLVDGNGGSDVAFLGDGDDVFVWDPGDGSDTIEGEAGLDTMLFNGAGGAEQVDLSANGDRLRFFRVQANITMDTAGVERVDFNAFGGADTITVDDLAGTDVNDVRVDLGGDGVADRIVVNGTGGDDIVSVKGDAAGVSVSGSQATVSISHQESTDELDVNGLGGDDTIDASGLAALAIALVADGGSGKDTLAGAQGIETLRGGDGEDILDGNGGNDQAFLGDGDDVFVWDPGDGSDTIEGEAGLDTMLFNGAGGAEQVDLSANGNRLRFFRTQANITMDTNDVERVDFNALGGADTITVNDLTGTDVNDVRLDLGAADLQADRVIVNATDGDDDIVVSGGAGDVTAVGLAATIAITDAEAGDRLDVNTLQGTDTVDFAALAANAIQLFVDGLLVN